MGPDRCVQRAGEPSHVHRRPPTVGIGFGDVPVETHEVLDRKDVRRRLPEAENRENQTRSVAEWLGDLAARAAAPLSILLSPRPSGHLRLARSSRGPPPQLGCLRSSSHAPAPPCPKPLVPCRRPAPAFTFLLPGGRFPRPLKLAAPLLPLVGESGLPLRRLVDGSRGSLPQFCAQPACGPLSLVFRRRRPDRWAVRHAR